MAKIRQDIIDHILDIARIEDVVADFPEIKLKKQGVRFIGICPFHDDKGYGNFSVYPKDNVFKCFKCEQSGDALTFLMKHLNLSFPDAIRWLGKKYCVEVDNVPFSYTPPPPRPTPPPLPTLWLPRNMVRQRMTGLEHDNLVRFINTQVNWGNEQRARIAPVLHDYCVGHSTIRQQYGDHEFTVFWQIDYDGHPRTAHYMKYKENGHRLKENEGKYVTDWLHSLLSRGGYKQYYDEEKQAHRLCLFGEHLLRKYPTATVKLVESEKTAILMAIAYGNNPMQVWLACCGASNLTRERLRPLIQQHRNVVLYPDRDGIDLWKQKAEAIYYDRLTIDTKPVKEWWRECDGPKADIADVVLRMLNTSRTYKSIGEVLDDVPIVKPLIEKLNLTTDEQ
jgi:hypothetical protein